MKDLLDKESKYIVHLITAESLTDMVCSAIIACTEPKVASFQLLKSYIKEHHSEFNIEAKPFLLKKAITRGIKNNIIL